MYQFSIVTLLSHHQFVLHRLGKDTLTITSRAWHLQSRREGA